ncbi:MAG: C40 family peptidase [Acidobacteriales bacterium]|nr:C40 family peptidase [Terriglobales bacterium]
MSTAARTALSLIVLFAGQAALAAAKGDTGARLLTRREGASLVRRVLDYRVANRKLDCSHLMHEALTAAGVNYPYAPSFNIFAGIPQFRRVRSAQPGDLIVWPGHVGLVVSVDQRTFYSSTGNGIRVDEYSSDYWRSRGTPRFYRYVVTSEMNSAIHRSLRAATSTPPASGGSAIAPSQSTSLAESQSVPAHATDSLFSYEIPESIQIVTERAKPTRAEVEEALSELSNAAAPALENEDRATSLLLIRELKVTRVQTTGDKGWAEVRTPSAIELGVDGAWKRVRLPKQRWELRRGEQGWIVFTPLDRIYVSQKVAIPLLASQLSKPRASQAGTRPAQSENLSVLLTVLRREN